MMGVMEQEKTVGPINLGNPTEFTIKELAQKVLSMVNSSSDSCGKAFAFG